MNKNLLVWTIFFVLLQGSPVFAATFSADSRIAARGKTVESRLLYAGDRWRMEEHRPHGEFRVTIFRKDMKALFILWPEKKRYFRQPLPEDQFAMISQMKPGEEMERTKLGQENISGYPTTKYLVKYRLLEHKIEKFFTSIEWFSSRLGLVIKSEAEDKSWSTEMTNIKEEKPDQSFFEIPEGYQLLTKQDVFKSNNK